MKKFTFIAAALIVMSGSAAAQKRFTHNVADGARKVLPVPEKQLAKVPAKAEEISGALYMPQHEEVYFYENIWKNTGHTDYVYDVNGNVLISTYVTDDGTIKTYYTYDENNQWIEQIVYSYDTAGKLLVTPGTTYKRTRVFDSIVKDLVVESMEYDIKVDTEGNESWTLVDRGRTWKRDVARNDKNRVTGVTVSAYWGNAYEVTRRSTVTYDADGLAETWKYEELQFSDSKGYYWEEFYTLVDMQWLSTDGQIVVESYLPDFFEGNNRLKSAKVTVTGYGEVGTISAVYEENGDYTYSFNYNDPLARDFYTVRTTDDNGSMEQCSYYYQDLNEDGQLTDDELVETTKAVVTYNDKGDIISEETYLDDDLIGASTYEIVYGDYAYPTEWAMSDYDYDTQRYVPYIKLVRSDFVDVTTQTAIDGVATERDGGVQGVYNLQGVRVASQMDNLPAGLYIVKKDGKTLKVVRK